MLALRIPITQSRSFQARAHVQLRFDFRESVSYLRTRPEYRSPRAITIIASVAFAITAIAARGLDVEVIRE